MTCSGNDTPLSDLKGGGGPKGKGPSAKKSVKKAAKKKK
jgi:hypothetical protein